MTSRRGECVFCEKYGALTKEDPLPRWIAEILREMYPQTLGVQVVTKVFDGADVASESVRKYGAANAYKLPVICSSCNNGWMSEIERATKPILSPMIRGIRTGITLDQQKVIATWLTLKVLTFDLLGDPVSRTASAEDFHSFYRDPVPPRAFAVWLGRYESDDKKDMVFHHTAPIAVGEVHGDYAVGSPHSVRFTLIVGHLVLQAQFETERAKDYPGGVYWEDPNPHLARVWPLLRIVDWPPSRVLTPNDLPSFTGQTMAGKQVGQ